MSLQVFILGVLCAGNHHPYDIKKMFKRKNIDEIQKINDGTLYYNFDVLLKKGYIEKIEVTRDENRPQKTTYGITDAGRQALEQEIYTKFKNFTDVESLYSAALFIKHADPNKLAFLIEEGIEKLQGKIQHHHEIWLTIRDESPPIIHLIQDHTLSRIKLELDWLEKLLVHVKNERQ
ncbi:PadR family transcriptional regulator [Paenibacillus sp. FJAT-26967]|uniref:PadR family transcriptional regulator n=1 Tax=Paenibacillus sp. FJAT-26967 TaxID=1729690 RepID=UPI0008391704|nr:PadR family transcriptional regulator [Paenibacillus sp. FJAT-26967]